MELGPASHHLVDPSAADLKFLHHLPRTRPGTSNRKAALEAFICQYPFDSEVRIRGCRTVMRTSESGHGSSMIALSIIIPTLNEEAGIESALDALATLRAAGCEVIVADGGSGDRTAALARPRCDQIVAAPRGRGVGHLRNDSVHPVV